MMCEQHPIFISLPSMFAERILERSARNGMMNDPVVKRNFEIIGDTRQALNSPLIDRGLHFATMEKAVKRGKSTESKGEIHSEYPCYSMFIARELRGKNGRHMLQNSEGLANIENHRELNAGESLTELNLSLMNIAWRNDLMARKPSLELF
jgi:hypothetical protein